MAESCKEFSRATITFVSHEPIGDQGDEYRTAGIAYMDSSGVISVDTLDGYRNWFVGTVALRAARGQEPEDGGPVLDWWAQMLDVLWTECRSGFSGSTWELVTPPPAVLRRCWAAGSHWAKLRLPEKGRPPFEFWVRSPSPGASELTTETVGQLCIVWTADGGLVRDTILPTINWAATFSDDKLEPRTAASIQPLPYHLYPHRGK